MVDRCICCGEPVPEGRKVCRKCNAVIEGKRLRDYAEIHLLGEQASAIKDVLRERCRQDLKWGRQNHALSKWMEMCRESWRRKMDWKEAAKGGFIPSTDEIEV